MKKAETMSRPAARFAVSVLLGLVAVLAAMAVCSFGVLAGPLSGVSYAVLAPGCLALGCLLAAFRAARCMPGRKLLWAVLAGGGLLLCLIICSFACFGGPVEGSRVAVNAGCALAASLLGGFLGAAGRKRKRKR